MDDLTSKIPIDPPHLTDRRPRSDYPLGGKITGPAWRAAWSLLRKAYGSGEYLPSSVVAAKVVEILRLGTPPVEVSPNTVKTLLLSANKFGVLDKEYQDVNSRRQATFRISEEWLAR